TARARRPRAARPRPRRTTETAPRQPDRRPRLRPQQLPPPTLAARDQAGDRATPNRARLRPRPRALGRRAHLRLAAQPPPPAHPHRPPPPNPRSIPRPRLLPHLLAPNRDLIQLELLSAGSAAKTGTGSWGARYSSQRRTTIEALWPPK